MPRASRLLLLCRNRLHSRADWSSAAVAPPALHWALCTYVGHMEYCNNSERQHMASLRNAIKRKTHKERSQPQHRAKLGLLEKHSDYVERARNYHEKEKRLGILKEKAVNRNPDEFYFGMEKTGTKDGVHMLANGKSLTAKQTKNLKTSDLQYLKMKTAAENSKISKLQSGLHVLATEEKLNSHTIFVDDEREAREFDPVKHFDTVEELIDCAHNRPTVEVLQNATVLGTTDKRSLKKIEKMKSRSYRELGEREKRKTALTDLEADLQLQKNLLGKGKRKKVSDGVNGGPAVYKWAKQRRR